MYEILTIFTGFVFIYSSTAGSIARTWVSGAIVFSAFAWLIGPLALDLVDLKLDREGLRALAEVTLALVLFTDAANADLVVLRRNIGLPRRLLLVGLPLTIALGFGVGFALLDSLTFVELALLATILAPTDAALSAAVISDPRVPANIRQGLNFESGLNDGICVPVLFLALATQSGGEASGTELALTLIAEEIGIGLAVGLPLAFLGAHLLRYCRAKGWITKVWQQLPVVALALVSFALAQLLGGSGFITAFTGGLLFGALYKQHKQELLEAAEGAGKTIAVGKPDGLVKVLCDPKTDELLGAHIVGHNATELLHELLLAHNAELLPEDIANTIHAHPTISEAIMETMRGVSGKAIHA